MKVSKKVVDSALEKGPEIMMEGVKDVAPKLGVAAAAGKVAAEAFKHTSGMAPIPRIAVVGGAVSSNEGSTSIGLELGKRASENKKAAEIEASKSKLDEINKDGSNSPSDFYRGFIYSVLEDCEIPLIAMVIGLGFLNYIEFSLVFKFILSII